jgi:hypothetical protein
MHQRLRSKLTYANVMATIAVFGVIAGGSAWAASKIGTNQIKNGAVTAKKLHSKAVTTKKIKNNAVNGDKVADGSIGTADLGDNTVSNAKIQGDAVDKAKIASNSVGANELGPVVQRTNTITVPAGSARIVSQTCQQNELALSVGANWNGAQTVGPVLQAATFLTGQNEPTGGSAAGRNDFGSPRILTVSVACLQG